MKHKTYADLVASVHDCNLCEMIHCVFLLFGIARYLQMSSDTILYEPEKVAVEQDAEMHRILKNPEINLRMEPQSSSLLISSYCYFGRLHVYKSLGEWLQFKRWTCKILAFVTDNRVQKTS